MGPGKPTAVKEKAAGKTEYNYKDMLYMERGSRSRAGGSLRFLSVFLSPEGFREFSHSKEKGAAAKYGSAFRYFFEQPIRGDFAA